jgi:hypothetical protein
MRTRTAGLLSTALFVLAFSAASAQTTPVKCKDGTTSTTSGKGACSGHGGVAAATTASTAKADAKTAKQDAKAVSKTVKADGKADAKTAKADTKVAKSDAKSAAKQVKCTDGTMSKGGRGACSGHGGIAKAGK